MIEAALPPSPFMYLSSLVGSGSEYIPQQTREGKVLKQPLVQGMIPVGME